MGRIRIMSTANKDVSLYSFWSMFLQHKRIFSITFCTVMLFGIAVILLSPTKYLYSQPIEVAHGLDDSGYTHYVFDESHVLVSLAQIYIPRAMGRYNRDLSKKLRAPIHAISVGGLKKSGSIHGIIALEAKIPTSEEKQYSDIYSDIVTALNKGEQRKLQNLKLVLKTLIDHTKIKQLSNELDLTLLKSQENVIKHNIDSVSKSIEKMQGHVASAGSGTADARILTNVFTGRIAIEERAQLNTLLYKNLGAKLFALQSALTKAKVEKETLHLSLQLLQRRLHSVEASSIYGGAIQSFKHVGMGRGIMLLLALVLSFFAAIFSILVVSFVGRFKELNAETNG